jgi:predicted nucleic acid-binding protein
LAAKVSKPEKRYWDSCCFIGYLANEQDKAAECESVLREAEAGRITIVTSAFTLTEVLRMKDRPPLPEADEARIDAAFYQSYIVLRQVDRRAGELARRVVWRYGIRPKDAIHVATALLSDVDHMDTTDKNLIKASAIKVEGFEPLTVRWPMVAQGQLDLSGTSDTETDTADSESAPTT